MHIIIIYVYLIGHNCYCEIIYKSSYCLRMLGSNIKNILLQVVIPDSKIT